MMDYAGKNRAAVPARALAAIRSLGCGALSMKMNTADRPGKRYAVHYTPADHRLGDVHPFFENGVCHLFYLRSGGRFESQRLVSRDLLSWNVAPAVMSGTGEPPVPFFVVAVARNRVAGTYLSYHGRERGRMAATVSDDLATWRSAPSDGHIPAVDGVYEARRDPYVFWNEDDGQYWCVMTTGMPAKNGVLPGAFSYAVSRDLTHWENRGILFYPGTIELPECPQLFKIGKKWYLLASLLAGVVGRPTYWTADAAAGPWNDSTRRVLDGKDVCAAQVAFDGAKWVLMGWIPGGPPRQWGGHLALPREVFQHPDGLLGTRLEAAVARRIRGERTVAIPSAAVMPSGTFGMAGPGSRMDMQFCLTIEAGCRESGVRIGTDKVSNAVEVAVLPQSGFLVIRQGPDGLWASMPVCVQEGHPLDIRIVLDEDIVEVFLDGTTSLAGKVDAERTGIALSLFSEGGASVFKDVELFRLISFNGQAV